MEKNKKILSVLFIVVFFLVVIMLGIVSFIKLAKFYVNDEIDYNEWTADLGSPYETDIATNFCGKFQFVNINGAVRNLLGQHEMNGVVKLNNGYLVTPLSYTYAEKLEEYANKVIALNEYLKDQDIQLLYAAPPYTVSKYDMQLPAGVKDFGNGNMDYFLQKLYDAGVETMDFRVIMNADGIDQYDMMYKTDHHWTTEAGFYAYGKLEKYLVDRLDCEVDKRISDIRYYTTTSYEEWHLGSYGQRTGIYYSGIDDFKLILPDFETRLQNEDGIIGTMESLMINMDPLKNKIYTSRYTYDYVLDKSLGNYVNLNCKNDKKILFMTDSFGKAVAPYLILGFGEVRFIDNGDSEMLTKEYIEEYQPDAVIMLYYPKRLSDSSPAFAFEGF